jgi:ribosomal protein S27E
MHAKRLTGSPARLGINALLAFKGPAQPSPSLGDALNARYGYLEVKCLGCDTHQTIALDVIRRPKTTPIHELERYMRCKDCSRVRGYPSSAATCALRPNKITASGPPSTWWPDER